MDMLNWRKALDAKNYELRYRNELRMILKEYLQQNTALVIGDAKIYIDTQGDLKLFDNKYNICYSGSDIVVYLYNNENVLDKLLKRIL